MGNIGGIGSESFGNVGYGFESHQNEIPSIQDQIDVINDNIEYLIALVQGLSGSTGGLGFLK